VDTEVVDVETGDRLVTDITDAVRRFCQGHADGLCHVFLPHATAGLALIEVGSGTEADLEALVDRLVPREGEYVHRHGSAGHGGDHVLPAFVSPSLVLPVQAGRVLLGTWQSVVVVDSNVDNARRQVRLSFLADVSR
jgi:secondary thiamine-phosphate synthase enzyme